MKEFKFSLSFIFLLYLYAILSKTSATTKAWTQKLHPKILAILPPHQNYKDRFLQYNPQFKPTITPNPLLPNGKHNATVFSTMYSYVKINDKGIGLEKPNTAHYLPYQGPKNIYDVAAIPIPTVSEFGEYCDAYHRCNSAKLLECIDEKCYCEHSAHRFYDETLKECVNLVGSECSLTSISNHHANAIESGIPFPFPTRSYASARLFFSKNKNPKDKFSYPHPENFYEPRCTKNSICSWNANICECKKGYVETDSRMCLLDIDQPCQANLCNRDRGLGCKKGVCQCIDSRDNYVEVTKRCTDMKELVKRVSAYVHKGALVYALSRSLDLMQDVPLSLLGLPTG